MPPQSPRHRLPAGHDPALREKIYADLLTEQARLARLLDKQRARIREQDKLEALLREVHRQAGSAATSR